MKPASRLTYDDIVKNIFTNQKTGKRYAAELIGTVLKVSPKEIYNNLEYIHPQIKFNKNVVGSTTDIAFSTDKILIDIEVNRSSGKRRKVQNETYLFQLYLSELKNYKDYDTLKPVIQINLDNYDYLNKNEFIYCSMLMDTRFHEITSENIKIFHINLKLLRKNEDFKEISADRLKTILYFLASSNSKIISKLYEGDDLMKEVQKQAEKFANNIDWADEYFDSDEFFRLDVRDEIKDEIRDEVIAEVRNEVKAEVKEEVKKDVEKEIKNDFIKNMVMANVSDDIILKSTKISKKELEKIKVEIKNTEM